MKKISPPLVGGDEGEGEMFISTPTPTLSLPPPAYRRQALKGKG
jgi:hypothetical protein